MIYKILIFAIIVFSKVNGFTPNTYAGDLDLFLVALGKVESNNNDNAKGDLVNGKYMAYGRYQIWESYYQDAKSFDKSLATTTYSDVKNFNTARRVVLAYFARYEPKALEVKNFEVLSRLHNLGPSWRKKSKLADGYWLKIKKELYKN